jgi:DNA-binding GntR family transcriptional regulator
MPAAERRGNLRRIAPDNLRSQARRAIRTSITTGELQAGEIYPVSYFSSQLGVSGTPVREALFDLAHEGLVEVIRNRGFRVVQLSDNDLDEIFECRLLLEAPAAGKVAGRLSAAEIAQARAYAASIEQYALERDLVGFLEADRLFHGCLLDAIDNPRLSDFILQLRAQARLNGLRQMQPHELLATAREHEGILNAVERADAQEAETLMRHHLVHSRGIWVGRAEAHTPNTAVLTGSSGAATRQ